MSKYTVVGGNGFIGGEVVDKLKRYDHSIFIPEKNDQRLFSDELGVVIYCAGHGDCNNNAQKVLNSNTTLLAEILEKSNFDKLIYISSTRVYMGIDDSQECSDLRILNGDGRRLFNLTKLVSEELCLLSDRKTVIVRPSNVYGPAFDSKLFLPSLVRDAVTLGEINMYVSKEYSKDYVHVDDVCDFIYKLSVSDRYVHKIYNVASGVNVSAEKIANVLHSITGCNVIWNDSGADDYFPITQVDAAIIDFGYEPKDFESSVLSMVDEFKMRDL